MTEFTGIFTQDNLSVSNTVRLRDFVFPEMVSLSLGGFFWSMNLNF